MLLEQFPPEELRKLLKQTLTIIIDFYSFYYAKQKELPTIEELVAVLMYELRLDKETVYELLELLNHKGIILWDGKKYQVNYSILME